MNEYRPFVQMARFLNGFEYFDHTGIDLDAVENNLIALVTLQNCTIDLHPSRIAQQRRT